MQIEQTALASGLSVITARLEDFETACVVVVVRAGARDENTGNAGVAHFLEHMAFKGTATRSALDISMEIECLGASINAFTSHEITAYHIVGLRQSVADAVEILGDVLTASRYAPEDVDLERGVIAQEIARHGDDPHSLCIDGFLATAYPDQSLGRPVLGDPAFVAAAARADLMAFIGRRYRTRDMVVVASGNVDHGWVTGLVERHFAAIPEGAAEGARVKAAYEGGVFTLARPDFKQINVVIGFPSVPVDAPSFHAHKMLTAALGGGMSSPLFQEVRQKRGLVYGVGSGAHNGTDFGLFLIQAGMTPENLAQFMTVACAEAVRIGHTLNPRDLTRARNGMLAELATVKEKPFSLAIYLAGQFFRHGRAIGPQVDLDAVHAVTADDVVEAATTVLRGRPTVSLVGPLVEADYRGMVDDALAVAA